MITYLIIDDEPIAHEIVKGYADLLPNMKLAKHCYDAIEALAYLQGNPVDLIFLDLNMPKLKGFDFLRTLQNPPKVIVTTAYKEYALEGYELNVIDYLLKPFSFERFLKAINKTIQQKGYPPQSEAIKNEEEPFIFLYSDKKHIQVKLNDILLVEAAGNYCKVILKEGQQILIREKISDALEMLATDKFIQVHKSFIVAKKHIETVEGNSIQIKEYQIPIGKVYKTKVLDFLKL
ncbi:LytR/AlgR family response regulator transcription factor [Maribacter ulvicola]|uniref:Two component transcriptional regulator, LytTR family n=1 Tax=Maribacter ulvicola TaxID=228959 RepID=A0A1N6Y0L3_9FLAO|nr:LytTR family DNA-binding domain-containing protein [Maribacter ulvicola]SIR08215.1 two component transcriptional regulator, LytTR family [Maribacter ulvicola]